MHGIMNCINSLSICKHCPERYDTMMVSALPFAEKDSCKDCVVFFCKKLIFTGVDIGEWIPKDSKNLFEHTKAIFFSYNEVFHNEKIRCDVLDLMISNDVKMRACPHFVEHTLLLNKYAGTNGN